MSARPWYKRYPSDFIAGTLSMTLEQKGAYSMVLDLLYDRGGPIPDDSQHIARVCGCSTRKWNQLRAELLAMGKLVAMDGCLDNPRSAKQRISEEKEHEKHSENGSKGQDKSKINQSKIQDKSEINDDASVKNNDLGEIRLPENVVDLTKNQTGIPEARSQKLEARKKEDLFGVPSGPPQKKATRLSNDWQASESDRQWCRTEFGWEGERIKLESEKFRDYWCAVGGKGGTKLDWVATWRNWCRNANERNPGKTSYRTREAAI